MDYIVQQCKDGKLDWHYLNNFIGWTLLRKEKMVNSLINKLNKVSKEPFSLPKVKPYIDSSQLQKESFLKEKSHLFNKEKFVSIIDQFFTSFGKDVFQKGEIYEIRLQKAADDDYVFDMYPESLIRIIDDNFSINKENLIENVASNWEWFSIQQIKKFLQRNQSELENSEIRLTDSETMVIKTWCDNYMPLIKFEEEITNGDIVFAWFIIRCKFTHYPEKSVSLSCKLQHYRIS